MSKRVLVIEDTPDNRQIIRDLLSASGYEDIVIDPHDATRSTWYACVFSGWGGVAGGPPNGLGGLYRTTNRGVSANECM